MIELYNIIADILLSIEVSLEDKTFKPFMEVSRYKNQLYDGTSKLSRDLAFVNIKNARTNLVKEVITNEYLEDGGYEHSYIRINWNADVEIIVYVGQPNNYTIIRDINNDNVLEDMETISNVKQFMIKYLSDYSNVDAFYYDSSIKINGMYLKALEEFDYADGDGAFMNFIYNVDFTEAIKKDKKYKLNIKDYDISCGCQ